MVGRALQRFGYSSFRGLNFVAPVLAVLFGGCLLDGESGYEVTPVTQSDDVRAFYAGVHGMLDARNVPVVFSFADASVPGDWGHVTYDAAKNGNYGAMQEFVATIVQEAVKQYGAPEVFLRVIRDTPFYSAAVEVHSDRVDLVVYSPATSDNEAVKQAVQQASAPSVMNRALLALYLQVKGLAETRACMPSIEPDLASQNIWMWNRDAFVQLFSTCGSIEQKLVGAHEGRVVHFCNQRGLVNEDTFCVDVSENLDDALAFVNATELSAWSTPIERQESPPPPVEPQGPGVPDETSTPPVTPTPAGTEPQFAAGMPTESGGCGTGGSGAAAGLLLLLLGFICRRDVLS